MAGKRLRLSIEQGDPALCCWSIEGAIARNFGRVLVTFVRQNDCSLMSLVGRLASRRSFVIRALGAFKVFFLQPGACSHSSSNSYSPQTTPQDQKWRVLQLHTISKSRKLIERPSQATPAGPGQAPFPATCRAGSHPIPPLTSRSRGRRLPAWRILH